MRDRMLTSRTALPTPRFSLPVRTMARFGSERTGEAANCGQFLMQLVWRRLTTPQTTLRGPGRDAQTVEKLAGRDGSNCQPFTGPCSEDRAHEVQVGRSRHTACGVRPRSASPRSRLK